MSSAPQQGKSSVSTEGPLGGVGKPESTRISPSFNPGNSMESQVGRPERTAGRQGGDEATPESTVRHEVAPATGVPSSEDPGVRNTGK